MLRLQDGLDNSVGGADRRGEVTEVANPGTSVIVSVDDLIESLPQPNNFQTLQQPD